MRIEWKKREKGLKNEMTKCKRRRKWERRMCKRLQPTSFGLLSPQQLAPFKVAVSPSNPFCNILSGENTDTPCWKKNPRGSISLEKFFYILFSNKKTWNNFRNISLKRVSSLFNFSSTVFVSFSPRAFNSLYCAARNGDQPRKERTLILKWKYVQHYFKTGFRTTHLTPNSDTTTICLRVCKSKTSDLSYF